MSSAPWQGRSAGSQMVPADTAVLTMAALFVAGGSLEEVAAEAASTVAALREEIARHDIAAGLAANQIGLAMRVAIVDLDGEPVAMINPQLFEMPTVNSFAITSRAQRAEKPLSPGPSLRAYAGRWGAASFVWSTEECLSLPGYTVQVPRRVAVFATWVTEGGDRAARLLEGGPAIVVQHEVDHLNGIPIWRHPGRRRVPGTDATAVTP